MTPLCDDNIMMVKKDTVISTVKLQNTKCEISDYAFFFLFLCIFG